MIISTLTQHTILIVQGADARQFLQGQVTCNIDKLKDGDEQYFSLFGAHCNHQGKILFNFQLCLLNDDTALLKIPNDMTELALSTLGKYIVFSKAELQDAQQHYQLYGIHTNDTKALTLPYHLLKTNSQATIIEQSIFMRLDDQHYELWLHNNDTAQFANIVNKASNNNTLWQAWRFQQKVVDILPATSGEFTPQAISFQNIGVSFEKGCYTGQEVVARMHYLGKNKHQLFLFTTNDVNTELHIKQPLYRHGDNKVVGKVVNFTHVDNGLLVLASANINDVDNHQIHLGYDSSQLVLLNPISNDEKSD